MAGRSKLTIPDLAVKKAAGERLVMVAVGEAITTRSVIGSEFHVTLKGVTESAGRPAVLPRISGRGWRFGETVIETHPGDAFAAGYAVSDVWGVEAAMLDRDG